MFNCYKSSILIKECFQKVYNATKKAVYPISSQSLNGYGSPYLHLFNDVDLLGVTYEDF